MASNQQPAADDLVPVLIYVIIKVSCELIVIKLLIKLFKLGKSTLLTKHN